MSDKDKDIETEKFKSFNKKRVKKEEFKNMSPYEIINKYREEDIKKNFKILNDNKFLKRLIVVTFSIVFLISVYSMGSNGDFIKDNVQVFFSNMESSRQANDIVDNFVEYLIQGDNEKIIEAYRNTASKSKENSFELALLLNSINNKEQSKQQLSSLMTKVYSDLEVNNSKENKDLLYKIIDLNILDKNLEEVNSILNKTRNILYNDVKFIEKEIAVMLLENREIEAKEKVSSLNLNNINDLDSLISYANLNVIFKEFDKALMALDKALGIEPNNLDILMVIETMKNYDLEYLNNVVNTLIDINPNNVNYKLFRAKINSDNLEFTSRNIEDIDEFVRSNPQEILTKAIRLEILTKASRIEEANILANELKKIEDKDYETYLLLSKFEFTTNNYNDAINYIKESIKLNPDKGYLYGVLLDILIKQNKNVNLNYYYLKMKIDDVINTNIDKMFSKKYTENLNDGNKAIDILNYASEISLYESELRYDLARIYIDQREDEKAKENLYKAIELDGSKSNYYRTLGVLLINGGETDDGISNIRYAYSLDENDVLNLNNAAVYYANIEKDIPRAFSNIKAAYEGINDSYNEYESAIIRGNFFKLQSVYSEAEGKTTGELTEILDFLY